MHWPLRKKFNNEELAEHPNPFCLLLLGLSHTPPWFGFGFAALKVRGEDAIVGATLRKGGGCQSVSKPEGWKRGCQGIGPPEGRERQLWDRNAMLVRVRGHHNWSCR